MSLIIEDGSIVSGANSYVSTTDLAAYAAARGITISGTQEQLLLQAMDYIESLNFKGVKFTSDQALQWPRADVIIDGYLVSADSIPAELIKGQIETALAIDGGGGPLIDLQPNVSHERVGEIEVSYARGTSSNVFNRKIGAALRKLINGEGMLVVTRA